MRFAIRYGNDPETVDLIGGPEVWALLQEAGESLDGPRCPFCGSAPEIVLGRQFARPSARIRCSACGCSTPAEASGLVPSWDLEGRLVYEPVSIIGALMIAMKSWMRRPGEPAQEEDAFPRRLRA